MQPLPPPSSSDPRVSDPRVGSNSASNSRLALNTERKASPDVSQRIAPLPSPTGSSISSHQNRQFTHRSDAGSDTASSESSTTRVSDPKSEPKSDSRSDSRSDIDDAIMLFGIIKLVPKDKKAKKETDAKSKSAPAVNVPTAVELEASLKEKVDKYGKGNYEVLSPAAVKNLAPQARQKLLSWCKWQETILKSETSLKLLADLIDRIEVVQKAKMNVRFIEAVNGNKDDEFISSLCLNNECVIETKVFLEIILQSLKDEKLKKHHAELSGLCVRWVHENSGTKWLREKRVDTKSQKEVPNETRSLINIIAEQVPDLKPFLNLKRKEKPKPVLNDGEKAPTDFEKMVEEIYSFEYGAAVASYAETIANDLLYYQVQLLSQVEEKDLVDKWEAKPQSMERSKHFQECLSNYIADTVLKFPDVSQRARVLSFFVLLCDVACKKGDFSSAMAISGALSMIAISRLKETWKIVIAIPQLSELCSTLSTLFDTGSNFKNLRTEMNARAQKGKIIPFMGILEKDITFSLDGGASIIMAEDGEPKYNLERVKDCRKMIRGYLAPLVHWKGELVKYEPKTNFIHFCLTNPTLHLELEERYNRREALSKKYEPVQKTVQKG